MIFLCIFIIIIISFYLLYILIRNKSPKSVTDTYVNKGVYLHNYEPYVIKQNTKPNYEEYDFEISDTSNSIFLKSVDTLLRRLISTDVLNNYSESVISSNSDLNLTGVGDFLASNKQKITSDGYKCISVNGRQYLFDKGNNLISPTDNKWKQPDTMDIPTKCTTSPCHIPYWLSTLYAISMLKNNIGTSVDGNVKLLKLPDFISSKFDNASLNSCNTDSVDKCIRKSDSTVAPRGDICIASDEAALLALFKIGKINNLAIYDYVPVTGQYGGDNIVASTIDETTSGLLNIKLDAYGEYMLISYLSNQVFDLEEYNINDNQFLRNAFITQFSGLSTEPVIIEKNTSYDLLKCFMNNHTIYSFIKLMESGNFFIPTTVKLSPYAVESFENGFITTNKFVNNLDNMLYSMIRNSNYLENNNKTWFPLDSESKCSTQTSLLQTQYNQNNFALSKGSANGGTKVIYINGVSYVLDKNNEIVFEHGVAFEDTFFLNKNYKGDDECSPYQYTSGDDGSCYTKPPWWVLILYIITSVKAGLSVNGEANVVKCDKLSIIELDYVKDYIKTLPSKYSKEASVLVAFLTNDENKDILSMGNRSNFPSNLVIGPTHNHLDTLVCDAHTCSSEMSTNGFINCLLTDRYISMIFDIIKKSSVFSLGYNNTVIIPKHKAKFSTILPNPLPKVGAENSILVQENILEQSDFALKLLRPPCFSLDYSSLVELLTITDLILPKNDTPTYVSSDVNGNVVYTNEGMNEIHKELLVANNRIDTVINEYKKLSINSLSDISTDDETWKAIREAFTFLNNALGKIRYNANLDFIELVKVMGIGSSPDSIVSIRSMVNSSYLRELNFIQSKNKEILKLKIISDTIKSISQEKWNAFLNEKGTAAELKVAKENLQKDIHASIMDFISKNTGFKVPVNNCASIASTDIDALTTCYTNDKQKSTQGKITSATQGTIDSSCFTNDVEFRACLDHANTVNYLKENVYFPSQTGCTDSESSYKQCAINKQNNSQACKDNSANCVNINKGPCYENNPPTGYTSSSDCLLDKSTVNLQGKVFGESNTGCFTSSNIEKCYADSGIKNVVQNGVADGLGIDSSCLDSSSELLNCYEEKGITDAKDVISKRLGIDSSCFNSVTDVANCYKQKGINMFDSEVSSKLGIDASCFNGIDNVLDCYKQLGIDKIKQKLSDYENDVKNKLGNAIGLSPSCITDNFNTVSNCIKNKAESSMYAYASDELGLELPPTCAPPNTSVKCFEDAAISDAYSNAGSMFGLDISCATPEHPLNCLKNDASKYVENYLGEQLLGDASFSCPDITKPLQCLENYVKNRVQKAITDAVDDATTDVQEAIMDKLSDLADESGLSDIYELVSETVQNTVEYITEVALQAVGDLLEAAGVDTAIGVATTAAESISLASEAAAEAAADFASDAVAVIASSVAEEIGMDFLFALCFL